MAPQCTTSGQSRSTLRRQSKSLQKLQHTFCFVHSHTCKFGGKNHGICGGTEIPSIHNSLDLDTSWAIIPTPFYWRHLSSRHNARGGGGGRGSRKVGNLYFYQTSLGDFYLLIVAGEREGGREGERLICYSTYLLCSHW